MYWSAVRELRASRLIDSRDLRFFVSRVRRDDLSELRVGEGMLALMKEAELLRVNCQLVRIIENQFSSRC